MIGWLVGWLVGFYGILTLDFRFIWFIKFSSSLSLKDLFGLIWFYGISIIVGYLMPNPVFTYILNT